MGKLIKRGLSGMVVERTGPYDATIYLEKDPIEEEIPASLFKIWTPGTTPEERMDQTVQELTPIIDPFTNKLVRPSTYQPTLEQRHAGTGTEHPTSWVDYIAGLAPLAIPAIVSAPYWGPAAATTLTSPAFWTNVATKTIPNLIKDTALYAAADAASEATTNRGLGANINRLFDLEDNHPLGDFIGFGGTSMLRRPIEKAGIAAYKGLRGAIQPEYAPSYAMDLSLLKPHISRVVGENGKIRLRLPSHTDATPREIVLEPQGNNKFYVHVRTWNDIDGKIPANLTQREISLLYEGLYDALPEGAEILFPKSSSDYLATRGTVAALKKLARDPRYAPGTKGKLKYEDKNKKVKIFKGTSFFKRIDENPEYIERQLIPFAKSQGNWNGKSDIVNNIKVKYYNRAPWAGMFNGQNILLNTGTYYDLNNIMMHELRHAYDFSPKWRTASGDGWFKKFMSSSPFYWEKQDSPIKLSKQQLLLLDKAYPTKLADKFRISVSKAKEKVAVNAEFRKHLDNLYFQKFNKKPSVKELNTFIWSMSDEELAGELAKYGLDLSAYMHTYVQNMINNPLKIPGNYFKVEVGPKHNLMVNKSLLNKQQLRLVRYALTNVPSLAAPVMLVNIKNKN